jgi:hypothetical protein
MTTAEIKYIKRQINKKKRERLAMAGINGRSPKADKIEFSPAINKIAFEFYAELPHIRASAKYAILHLPYKRGAK